MTETNQLLREYAQTGSEAAFRELVKRYVDLVYSTALRRAGGDAQLTQDIAQTVFADFARKAQSLPKDVMLGGWLHHHTIFVASNFLRSERRRQNRERQALEMNALQEDSDAVWKQLAPVLDEAIDRLSAPDRDAILLRFFEQQDLREVGAALGISEGAAQKRVSRAVEQLREFFSKQGVGAGATGLAAVLSTNAVQAAPVGLAITISATALAGTAASTSTVIAATKAIAMTTLQKTLVAATVAVLAGAGIYESRQTSHLQEQVRSLQQQDSLAGQNDELHHQLDDAIGKLVAAQKENEQLHREAADISKLRAEVARLRGDSEELARLKSTAD